MLKHIQILLCVFLSLPCLSIDLTKINLSYLYDPINSVTFEYRLAKPSADRIALMASLDVAFPTSIRFLTQERYGDEDHRVIEPVKTDTLIEDGEYYYQYDFPAAQMDELLILETTHDSTVYYFPVEIDQDRLSRFYPWNSGPMVKNYATSAPEFRDATSVYAYVYGSGFGKADPPFGNMQALSPVINVDTVMLYSDTLTLDNGSFYFVQQDTSSAIGSGFLKVPPYFPRYRRIEELIAPLEYICSSREFSDIVSSSDLRVGFEDFWIGIANGKSGAKRAIRNFYRGVAVSNLLFTNYKPGWQTDRGMIYMIYGQPNEVKRTDRKEMWGYLSGEVFEFVKISTLFTPALYTLVRNPDYRDSWTERIKQIRVGL